uniref:CCHC-type domain-containing protein n=1 Tax=Bursaphelenchus xylophilus TaxID=6326 RepID=A0A1I7SL30_BURXY
MQISLFQIEPTCQLFGKIDKDLHTICSFDTVPIVINQKKFEVRSWTIGEKDDWGKGRLGKKTIGEKFVMESVPTEQPMGPGQPEQPAAGSDPVLKLFDRTCDSILMGRPSPDDVRKLLVIMVEDCRKLATYLAREQRARALSETRTATMTGKAEKGLVNVCKSLNDIDTMDLGLGMWSSVVNKDLRDLKDQVGGIKSLGNAVEANKKVLRSVRDKLDQVACQKGNDVARFEKLEENIAGIRGLYAEQAGGAAPAQSEAVGPQEQLDDATRPSYSWDDVPIELAGESGDQQTHNPANAPEEEPPIIASLECNSLLQPFNPNGSMTFQEWLEKFEDFRDQQATPWTNDVAVKKLRMFLNGEPRERLIKIAPATAPAEGGNQFKNFEEIKRELLESFNKDGGQAIARAELTVLRQQHDESVNAFLQRLKRLVARLDPDIPAPIREKRVFEEFMSRVRDDIANPLRLAVPENLEQARAKALAIESVNASSRLLSRDSMANGFATMVQALAGVNANGNNNSPKKGACFYCGIEGHFSRECRQRAREVQQGQAAFYRPSGGQHRAGGFRRPPNRGRASSWWNDEEDRSPRESVNLLTVQEAPEKEDQVVEKTEREKSLELMRQKHANLLKLHSSSSIQSLHPVNALASVMFLVTCLTVVSPSVGAIQPMICQHQFGRRLVGLPEPPECPQVNVKPKVRPATLLLDIFRENEQVSETPAEVCQVVRSQIRYFTTLSGVYVEQPAKPIKELVTPAQCRDILRSRRCIHGSLTPQKDGWATSNVFKKDRPWPFFGSFGWKSQTLRNCITFGAHVQYNSNSHVLTATAGDLQACNYTSGECNLQDGSAILWKPNPALDCPFIKVGTFLGRLLGNVWLSDSRQFALTISNDSVPFKSCNRTLVKTPQGFAIPLSAARAKRGTKVVASNTLSAELQGLEESMIQIIQHNFENVIHHICFAHQSAAAQWKLLAETNPTAVFRKLLRDDYIHATMLTESIAEIYPCRPIGNESIRPRPGPKTGCTRYIPIDLTDPTDSSKSKGAFLDPMTAIITDHSPTVPCDAAPPFLLNKGDGFLQIEQHDSAVSNFDLNQVSWLKLLAVPPQINHKVPLVVFSSSMAANLSTGISFHHWQAAARPELHTGEGGSKPDDEGFFVETRSPTLLNLLLPDWTVSQIWLYACAVLVTCDAIGSLLGTYFLAKWNAARHYARLRRERRRERRDQEIIWSFRELDEGPVYRDVVSAVNTIGKD